MGCRPSIAALAAAAALGCSSKEFQSDGGDAGDTGMGGTVTGGSGPGGSGGGGAGQPSGGSGGSAGIASGGSGGMACSCPRTEYCRGGECLPCSELATLDFGDPELVLDDPSGSLRFPRTGDTPSSLFYRVGNEGSARLYYTPDAGSLGSSVGSNAVLQESGPLFVNALGRNFNVIYDQTTDDPTSGLHRIMRAAAWSGGVLTGETDMPAPLSPGGHDDYSAAAATTSGRLFWMSTRDGVPRLRTGVIDTGEGEVIDIELPKRTGSGTCPREGADATPWVTPEGHRMFFSAFPLGDTCQPLDATTTDLFVVPLAPETGMPPLPAIALASLNEVGSTETDPSLSADFCFIYFASDRDAPGSDFRLYRAARR